MSKRLLTTISLLLLLISVSAGQALATTWNVPGNNSNTCTIVVPSCNTIAQAVTASSNGDTIQIGAGNFPVPASITLTKTLTIVGSGIGTTFVQPTSAAFSVRTNNIVFQDFTIQNGTTGIAFQNAASDNTQITRVSFSGQTSRGIDIQLAATFPVTNVTIADSTFATASIGIRTSSTAQVAGFTITGTTFTGNSYGIYVANDGNTSKFSGLTIQSSTFTNNTNYAIYAEEMRDAVIEDSSFTGGSAALGFFKFYGSNGVAMSNIAIRRNVFTGFKANAIDLEVYAFGLGSPVTIEDNTITKDVSISTVPAAVFVRLNPTLANGAVNIVDNGISLTGAFGATTAAHAIQLQGNGPVAITGNVLDGGNVGGTGTMPPTSGIFIQSRSGGTVMPATTVITASCNRIQGFRNGASVFDSVAGAYGGLTVGAAVTFTDNAILGNDHGIVTSAAAPTINAESNYWGCPAGPSDAACDDVVGNVDANPFLTVIAPCVACLQDFECNDGLFCDGAETCDVMTGQCVASTDPCVGGPVCENACNETDDNCFVPASTVCRSAVDTCDAAETCTGLGGGCPADLPASAGTECRASAGVCDVAETCDGVSTTCPADGFQPSSVPCRGAAGVCDVGESCTGAGPACPADGFAPATQECRASGGVCDVAENCTGTGSSCPVDAFQPSSTVCRSATDVCDAAENCTGGAAGCPADAVLPATTTCRPAAGDCDVAETCNGTATACPTDGFTPAGTSCSDANFCTQPDTCNGNGACAGTPVDCDDANPCTDEVCNSQGNGFLCVYTNNGSCTGPNCGNGVVDAGDGETCDPPNLTVGPNGQPLCRLDCTSCGDGVVQPANSETCDDGNTVSGCRIDQPQKPLDDCLNSCRLPICDDPSRIKLTSGLDQLAFHGRLVASSAVDFATNHFVVQLSNDGDVIYRDSLLAGSIVQMSPTSWKYRNKLAKKDGGIYSLKIHGKDGYYVFMVQAYGDGGDAVADMTTQVFAGTKEWALRGVWAPQAKSKGWRLTKKSQFLEP